MGLVGCMLLASRVSMSSVVYILWSALCVLCDLYLVDSVGCISWVLWAASSGFCGLHLAGSAGFMGSVGCI